MKYMRAPAPVRFERLYIPEPNSGCWLWEGSQQQGYGRFLFNGKRELSHRASYEMFCGEIPDGKCVLHRCDNPACVNPEHLFVGTHSDNMRDMVSKDRNAKRNRAKLSEDQVEEIKRLALDLTHSQIAARFGVTRATISNAVAGRTWGPS